MALKPKIEGTIAFQTKFKIKTKRASPAKARPTRLKFMEKPPFL
jgi:hypothetical protein